MPEPRILVFKNLDELSQAAAREFSSLATQSAAANGLFTVALSGGSTPKEFYQLLATPAFKIPWTRVHLFQVDERCVPPDHPQSNYKMIREALLDRAPLPAANFHRMAAEQPDREAAAENYATELRKTVGAGPGEWPRLDVIFLGMGEDGHTASLFPGTAALNERERAVCPNYVEKLKMYRLTLTLPTLNAAARAVFLVAGEAKAETVRQVLRSTDGTPPFPSQRIQPAYGSVTWYLDAAAARLL